MGKETGQGANSVFGKERTVTGANRDAALSGTVPTASDSVARVRWASDRDSLAVAYWAMSRRFELKSVTDSE